VPRDALGSDLRRLIGSDAVLTDEAARVLAGTDFITHRGAPAAVARPTSNDQVVELLRYATKHGVAIVPRGTATNLSAAIAPGDDSLVLDLASMNRIVEIDAEGRRAVVEPGVINADLKAAAAPLGLAYAPDPASAPISTIGGNIAENAGGPGCIKNGVTFHQRGEMKSLVTSTILRAPSETESGAAAWGPLLEVAIAATATTAMPSRPNPPIPCRMAPASRSDVVDQQPREIPWVPGR
jgi:hypothetical protein